MKALIEHGARVYIPGKEEDGEEPWLRAEVREVKSGGWVVVRLQEDGRMREVDLAAFGGGPLPLQNSRDVESVVEDMCKMDHLHEAALLDNLQRRAGRRLPYTYTGPIVIAVNPYEWIDDLYSPTTAKRYLRSKSRDELPPHIYATAMTAYNGLLEGGEDQSILVSGESGAGKTESVKIMMSMLAVASKSRAGVSKQQQQEQRKGSKLAGEGVEVVDRVLRSNPLLEAFGNAKTVRNDNSSRFGKFQQLQFSPLGVLVGSHCQTYLLEKSRVVGQASGERNYHIFYQLLRGPESWKGKVKLGGMGVEEFAYLSGGDLDTKVIEGVDDGKRFAMTVDALKVVGVEESQVQVMMSVLAGVLHVGNIELRPLDDDKCEVSSPGSLQTASQLLGCPSAEALSRVLCYRTVTAAGEVYQVPMPQHQAQHCRDALAKELYSRVFTWLVHAINRNTAAPPPAAAAHKKASRSGRSSPYGAVSLLDIFGFESLQVNSFEQFLINFANETLQQKFCYDIFKGVQAEYESEGVVWTHVDFQDNAETLGLIEGRMGVISVLNEECLRPKATDTSFISKLAALHAEHPHFDRPKLGAKDSFIVCHYAGRVQYEGVGFLEKNRDTLQADLSELLGRSQVSLIAELFAPQDDAAAGHHHHHHHRSGGHHHKRQGTLVAETVSTKFRRQLSMLMGEISRTQVQYVRCLKPNSIKAAGVFDGRLIVDQLRYAGVLEGIRVSRAAYPNRLPHGDFLHRFGVLLPLASSLRTDIRAAIQALLPAAAKDKARCQVGKTRVYFRAGVLEELEERRRKVLAVRVTKAQAAWRSYVWRRTYLELRAACVWTQSRRRMVVCRRSFVRQQEAALSLQCWARGVVAREALQGRRREAAASKLQAWVRGRKQRQAFVDARGGLVLLQSRIRRARAKKQAIELKAQADQQRKLEEQLQRLKAKLQEAGSTQVIVQQDREETLAMLQRLQEENQLLREENDGLRRQVQELKGKASTLQQHNATLEEKLASVLLTLKNRPAAPSAYYPSNLSQGTIRGGLAVGKGPISQGGARGGVRVLTEADLFTTQPLDPARSLVTRDDLLTLPDRVDVTLSCGKRYLCGGGGSKAMLQWLDTIGSSGGGPPSSARFILERAVDGGSRYCYRLRLRDSRRYVSLGGFFQRSRFRLTERRPEEAALFALQPVAHSRSFFHLNPQQQQPAAATGSERGEADESAEADEGEREARRLLLFQLLLHRPRREGAPLVLTPDGFVSFLGGPNSNATARSAVGPIAADGAGGCVFAMEAASLQHTHEEHEDLGYGLDKDLRAPKLSKRMRLFGSSNNSSSSHTLRRTLLTPTSSQVAAEQHHAPAAGLSRPAAGSGRRVASRVGAAVSSYLSSVFAAPAPAPPVKKERKKGGKRVTTATTYTTIGDRPMATAPPAPRHVSPAPPPGRAAAPTVAAAPVGSAAPAPPPPVMNVGPPLSARSLRETGSYCSSQSMTGSTSWGPHYDHRDMQGSSVDDELLMMPGGGAGHVEDMMDSRSVYHTVIHGIHEEDEEDEESSAEKRKQSGGCSCFLELLLALLWLAVAVLGAYVWYENGGSFGGVFSASLAREAPFRLREASSRKCFTGSRFVSCQSPQASSFTLLVPRGTDYHTQGGMLQETATGLCLHVGKRDVLTLGSCSDLSRAQGWQLMGGHLTNVLHGHIVVGKKGKVLPSSTKKANRAMLQGVAMLSSRDGVEASFSSFASLLIK